MIRRSIRYGVVAGIAALLSACGTLGPDYKRPAVATPATFTNVGPWKEGVPGDLIARGAWWQIFHDAELDRLEASAKVSNPTLQAYAARVDQARAIAGIAGSYLAPEVVAAPSVGRYAASAHRPDQPEKRVNNKAYESGAYRAPLLVGYELDLWGRLGRMTESARAQADAAAAEYQTAALTLESEIASVYFRLRQTDEERHILAQNIDLQQRARNLVAARQEGGLASELDLARVDTELALTRASAEDAHRRRDDLELALALLTGAVPESFKVKEAPFDVVPPAIPVGLPADLLERRPDIAQAEQRLVARSAEIGVAQAAYYPSIRLTAGVGFESGELSQLLDRGSLIWGMASSLFQPVFNGGRIGFDVKRAKAAHAEAVAVYQAQLLRAFREVEGSLATLRTLDGQARFQANARQSAARAVHLADVRYRAGLVIVVEVIDAQRSALRAEREALAVRSDQVATTIALVKALGGGWADRAGNVVATAAH